MSDRPRVLITRPGARSIPLRSALEAVGVDVENLDIMRLEALPESQAIRQALLDFDHYQVVVVVSPFAAECLAEGLDRYWPQLPLGPGYYAVGAGTAQALHERLGVSVHIPVASRENTSEALLQLASLQRLGQQRVLIVAGEGGRTLLADSFAQRGARVDRVALYRRSLMTPEGTGALHLADGNFSTLLVTSGEILKHLAGWCTPKTLNQPLIVSSQRLATLAYMLGFLHPIVAQGATSSALAEAVTDVCNLGGADHDDLEKG